MFLSSLRPSAFICGSRLFSVALSIAVVGGCGGSESLGTVSGRATFRGTAVTDGLVSLSNQETGVHAIGKIQPDGSFRLETENRRGLPTGTYQVAVVPGRAEFPIDPNAPLQLSKDVPHIPLKYRDPKTSKLTVEVNKGENTLNIDMQP